MGQNLENRVQPNAFAFLINRQVMAQRFFAFERGYPCLLPTGVDLLVKELTPEAGYLRRILLFGVVIL